MEREATQVTLDGSDMEAVEAGFKKPKTKRKISSDSAKCDIKKQAKHTVKCEWRIIS